MPPIPLLLSAGEASGDMYAARLATALRQRIDVQLFGMGGPQMRAAGVEIVMDYSEVAVVGITEILKHLPSLLQAMNRLVMEAVRRKPALAILTDFPGFHLRLARKLRPNGVQNVYYVCPQFWAWRPWRVNLIRRRFAKALCIFPFEKEFFSRAGVPTEFIGHPLVGAVVPTKDRKQFCEQHGLTPSRTVVTVLPGSRSAELLHHLPVLEEACARINGKVPAQFVVAAARPQDVDLLKTGWPSGLSLRVVEGETYNALAAADAAIVSSGTATVEAALLNVPAVVVYRVSPLTAKLAKPLVRTPYFAMVNLIAEKRVVPELVQDDFTPQAVADETLRLLQDPNARNNQRAGLAEVRRRLGPPGAVERAADQIVSLLEADAGNAS
ncbi:MAG TPA: lipid-A-disaccharide synthase [Candidatus Acidoferrum sp.]|jgi:lipid-A-disaccharide synthase|nr:lipid-A-disaccharide synthase [Candidatus Acidoferrum sp.]